MDGFFLNTDMFVRQSGTGIGMASSVFEIDYPWPLSLWPANPQGDYQGDI